MARFILIVILLTNCNNSNLTILKDLPGKLNEVSGIETLSNTLYMINDGANKPQLFVLNQKGNITNTLTIKAKNHDWEDLTTNHKDFIYIGDFGNNKSKRDNLRILKINPKNAINDTIHNVDYINFKYEDQNKFPPKKKQLYFDAEAFVWYNNFFYIFTKSRVKNNYGQTTVYKIPDFPGTHIAKKVGNFNTCNTSNCWITSADISANGKELVLLTPQELWVFTNFTNDLFFNGTKTQYTFNHNSQKEGVCFYNNSFLITDEKAHGVNGYLYMFKPKNY